MTKQKKYIPLGDNVLLEVLEKISEMYRAKVVAVGPGLATLGGRLKPRIKVGDVVLVDRYPASWVFIDSNKKKRLMIQHEHRIRLKCKS